MMNFMILALLLLSSFSWAQNPAWEEKIFSDRVELVKALKEFVVEAEEKHGLKITYDSSTGKWSLINEAYADEGYNCFYGGWPSTLKVVGSKKFCQQPQKISGWYEQGSCKEGELRCQPQLFGQNTCVNFSVAKDRQSTFSNCENKFRSSQDKDYKYTDKFEETDFMRLREIAALAQEVCSAKGKMGVQRTSPMCVKLNDKLEKHLKSLYNNTTIKPVNVQSSTKSEVVTPWIDKPVDKPVLSETKVPLKKEDCVICNKEIDDPIKHLEDHSAEVKKITDQVKDEVTLKYERMKEKFRKSVHCQPEKMFSQGDGLNPLIMHHVHQGGIKTFFSANNGVSHSRKMEEIKKFFPEGSTQYEEIGKSLQVATDLEKKRSPQSHMHMQVTRLLIMKHLNALEKTNPELLKDVYIASLESANIFSAESDDEDGGVVCPFPSEIAFRKAFEGFNKIKGGKDVTKKNQLTIVDYSMPSNHRRMFVMDMSSEDVLHNTWTAHGIGHPTAEEIKKENKSRYYENVQFSRKSGSWLTREGFMVAGTKRASPGYGEVINFYGKDLYNSYKPNSINDRQMTLDAVWMHASGAPAKDYLNRKNEIMKELDIELDPTKPGFDLQRTNIASSCLAMNLGTRQAKTMGCLGVTDMPINEIDKKGRQITQFQALKEDLPGSVVFAYSGPEQKSYYFK